MTTSNIQRSLQQISDTIDLLCQEIPTGNLTFKSYLLKRRELLSSFHRLGIAARNIGNWRYPKNSPEAFDFGRMQAYHPDNLTLSIFTFEWAKSNLNWILSPKVLNCIFDITKPMLNSQQLVYGDMMNTWETIRKWLEAVKNKCYLLLASAATIILIYIELLPNNFHSLFLIPPTVFILGVLPCIKPALLKISGKWNGLKWSSHHNQPYITVIEEAGQFMEKNIDRLMPEYIKAEKWLTRGRIGFAVGFLTGVALYVVFKVCGCIIEP